MEDPRKDASSQSKDKNTFWFRIPQKAQQLQTHISEKNQLRMIEMNDTFGPKYVES